MATKLAEKLNQQLTMAKFLNEEDLLKAALADRQMAADAIECVDAQVLAFEAELQLLMTDMSMTLALEPLEKILKDLKAATTVEANLPTKAG